MKLSVIIVNYNVKHFVEQCLHSVRKALKNIDAEVFVVDNNSVDGSCAMIRERFPEVHLIENKENFGFSFANNQAIKTSKGEYVLLLNPDTVVEESTFSKIIDFADTHPDAGGIGVRMIDGKGNFLPESKRGLPTPMVAFYKMFGLARLFPKSKTFGRYHLGFLDNEQIHEVEVLSGAFMLLRKKALDKTGLLDEDFFMYGEDIDISYRLVKNGYKNYYLPNTTIIHYKGESTKKSSVNYVFTFYNAMLIFARKHYSKKNADTLSFLIKTAVYFRATIAVLSRFLKTFLLPIIEALIIFAGFYLIKPYWEDFKFPQGGGYPPEFLLIAVPAYILIWLLSVFFSGGYEKPVRLLRIFQGIAYGTIIILVIYALLSEEARFSRALILIGSAWAFLSLTAIRFILHLLNFKHYKLGKSAKKRVVIVGGLEETARVYSLLKQTEIKPNVVGYVSPFANGFAAPFIGSIDQLGEIVRINKIDEIIFCAKDVSTQIIIKNMLTFSPEEVDYKIASPDSIAVIGSNSIHTSGELYVININSIARESNKRNKRLLDVILSLCFLALLPVLILVVTNKLGFIGNIVRVLSGNRSWVGYIVRKGVNISNLPKVRTGILNPLNSSGRNEFSGEVAEKFNMIYAKDYKLRNDIFIIVKGFKKLGTRT